MTEFRIEPETTSRSKMLVIVLGVVLVIAAGMGLYLHFRSPAPSATGPVYVPDVLRAGDTNFEYYKTRVKLEDVKASLGINYNKARIAMISGIVFNDGDRRLEAVEVHVKLFDVWGKLSKERTAFAVRPGIGINPKPMQPLERRTFTISLEGVEYYWNPKEISIEITGLKYQ